MKNIILYPILVALLLACGKVPTVAPNQGYNQFVNDFENKTLSNFYFLVKDSSYNTVFVSQPVRKGNYALKNILRPEDYVNNGYRTELSVYDRAKYKTEVYYGLSFLIDSSYADNAYNVICQWQDLPDYIQGEDWTTFPATGSPPPVHLTYVNGTIELKLNTNPNVSNKTFRVGDPVKISKGVWNDVVAHIYWSDDDKGYVEIWMNGNYITPFNGTDHKYYKRNLYSRDGNVFKFGQYRGKNKTAHTNTIYFDEIKIGNSFDFVKP